MASQFMFTVFTPTFNRAHTLPRVYESLRSQTFRDFEWVIVDDGSTDNTEELVRNWIAQAPFEIRYFKQKNSGKHVAHNLGVKKARGKLFAILDSDDWYLPQTLERFLYYWDSIPKSELSKYVGVTALCEDPSHKLIGTKFPKDVFDSNSIDIHTVHGVKGDKRGFLRTEVLKMYLYPEFANEKFVPDALVWHRIAQSYKTRFVNEVLSVTEYLPEGYTDSSARIRILSPQGSLLYYEELIKSDTFLPLRSKVRNYANFLRFCLHAGKGPLYYFKHVTPELITLLSFLIGYLVWLRDKKLVHN